MTSAPHHKFIFLCGLHRSGTTPLFHILRQHPQISGFQGTGVPEDEGQHLQSVFAPAIAFGGPGRFGFAEEARLTEASHTPISASADKLFLEWSKHWDSSREYLLEKSPPNLIRTRFLQACFPSSYFIVIIRHPIAVSLATLKWSPSRIASLLEHWLLCHRLFESDRAELQRVLVIRYEELILAPGVVLERVQQFLGLASSLKAQLDRDGNNRYFSAWHRFGHSAAGRVVFDDLVARYESSFLPYGYSVADCSQLFPSDRVAAFNVEVRALGDATVSIPTASV
ncbi:MAG TPA: sulfotransferase [Terriglobales bacterium]|nr:sulfotransferase [Terriglobales bacterium]